MRKFLKEDFDAASNRDGDNGADKAKDADADNDGDEDEGGGEVERVALDFGGDDIVFDLFVDDIKDEEDDSGCGCGTKEQDEGDKDTADNWSKHRDKIEYHRDKAHWEG